MFEMKVLEVVPSLLVEDCTGDGAGMAAADLSAASRLNPFDTDPIDGLEDGSKDAAGRMRDKLSLLCHWRASSTSVFNRSITTFFGTAFVDAAPSEALELETAAGLAAKEV